MLKRGIKIRGQLATLREYTYWLDFGKNKNIQKIFKHDKNISKKMYQGEKAYTGPT